MHGVMKYINDSLKLGTIVEQRIKEQDPKQLESAKMYLMERMGTPVGLHTAGVPFILSALLSVFSAGSIKLVNSAMFVKTSAFYLHNRIWRWQLKHHVQNTV